MADTQHTLLREFYIRLVGGSEEDKISIDDRDITFSFTGRDIDKSESVTVILLNGFMPTFDSISKHILGNKHEVMYKNLWTISMIVSYDNWLKFVSLTNKMNVVFTCETMDFNTGSKKFVSIFYTGKLIKGPWEYSIDLYSMANGFKWGSLRTFITKQGCRIRIQIEEQVSKFGQEIG